MTLCPYPTPADLRTPRSVLEEEGAPIPNLHIMSETPGQVEGKKQVLKAPPAKA